MFEEERIWPLIVFVIGGSVLLGAGVGLAMAQFLW